MNTPLVKQNLLVSVKFFTEMKYTFELKGNISLSGIAAWDRVACQRSFSGPFPHKGIKEKIMMSFLCLMDK